MHASVRAFLDQIIDYAGLFPPAKLPLEDAIASYLHACKTSPHTRMLRSFVCPVTRLHDFFEAAKVHGHPLAIAALGQQAAQASEFLPSVHADLEAIRKYRQTWLNALPVEPYDERDDEDNSAAQQQAHRKHAGIITYEVALPNGTAGTLVAPLLLGFAQALERANLRGFVEIPLSASWQGDLESVCQALTPTASIVGLKMRCGGLTADAFPSDAQVAFFIEKCRAQGLCWKATAGLHHPRRHWDPALQIWHHGFLNVFAAGVLAWTQSGTPDLGEILADRELGPLRFEPARMLWKTWECSTREIAEARMGFATSFGSCSFDEPSQELIEMGLLERDHIW